MNSCARSVLSSAQERGDISFGTVDAHADRFSQFVSYAKGEGVGRFERVDSELVTSYGRDVAERVEQGEISAGYGQNLVSSVNSVMREVSAVAGKNWEAVSPTKDCGIAERSFVREDAPVTLNREVADRAIAAAGKADERAGAVAELARELGLRSKEGSLLDARAAVQEARETGQISITNGTKGGQERSVPVSERGEAALERAATVQGEARSVMGENTNWKEFRDGALRDGRDAMHSEGVKGYHDARAAYACERYEQITGHQAPCVSGERDAPREVDREARNEISEELGHHRLDVVAAYVGGR